MPACPRPIYSPGLWKDILSLPTGYWMEGVLIADVIERGAIQLDRRVRDGVMVRGIFRSTRICSIDGSEVTTYNSVYLIEEVTRQVPDTDVLIVRLEVGRLSCAGSYRPISIESLVHEICASAASGSSRPTKPSSSQ